MKRFMLVSLMSCMLVGQTSCDWSWSDYGKGLVKGLGHTFLGTGIGAVSGFLFANAFGGNLSSGLYAREKLIRAIKACVAACAAAGCFCGAVLSAAETVDRSQPKKNNENSFDQQNDDTGADKKIMSKEERYGRHTPLVGVLGAPALYFTACGLYRSYKLLNE